MAPPAAPGTPTIAPERDVDIDLGARIRALRLARRQTLRDLAGHAGVTESFLSQVERGVASPSIASVQRIARALGQTIAELFAEHEVHGEVVRLVDRRRVTYPGLNAV